MFLEDFTNVHMALALSLACQRSKPATIFIDNGRQPWRPLPSQRLGEHQAKTLLLIIIPIALASSLYFGTAKHMLSIIALTWMYNDLEGANEHFLIQNIINALGMASLASGAMIIAGGGQSGSTPFGYQWITLVGFVIATTIQVQDFSDQAGDARRGRKTLPLVHGDGFARWTVVSSWRGRYLYRRFGKWALPYTYLHCVVEVYSECGRCICGEWKPMRRIGGCGASRWWLYPIWLWVLWQR